MNNEPNISIYDAEGGVEDFPVLKAFQQYIDAEQAKARKRLLTISIFFGIVLIAVIVIFSALVINANDRNQSLNDRLVEYAMKESERKVEAARTAALQEVSVKTMNDTLQKLQRQLEEQERKATSAAANAARELAAAKSQTGSAADAESEKRQAEANAKIQKAIALLKAEREKLAQEKEKFHQEEIERYRREHYPEFYARKSPSAKSAADIEPIEYYDDDETVIEEEDVKKPVRAKTKKKVKTAEPEELEDDDAIEYFKDDTYTIPVEVKGKRAGWRVPLD